MIKRSFHDLVWYEFEIFQTFSEIIHGVFTRYGGVSSGAFDSLNVSVSAGDEKDNVLKNKEKIKQALGIDSWAMPSIIHRDRVACIDREQTALGYDGLITGKQGLALAVTHADCQAACFFDPKEKLIANIHCGWRGNVVNIYQKTIASMEAKGSKRDNILVGISPSLGPQHAEFVNFQQELPESFWKYQVKPRYFDFWNISKDQLLDLGLLEKNIEIAEICTFDSLEFFSYRREKITGRNVTVVSLKR